MSNSIAGSAKGDKAFSLREIAAALGCAAPQSDITITGVSTLEDAAPGHISFLSTDALLKEFKASRASAVLVQKTVHLPQDTSIPVLTVDDAELALAKVLQLFAPSPERPDVGVDPRAFVDPSAQVAKDVCIGPFAYIGRRARIGAGSIIHPHVAIGDDVEIGDACEIFPSVTLRQRVRIGSRVTIHAGSVIGSDGFGYRWDGKQHTKIPHIGTVIIEDDVEIGSCTCVDRAKFSVTRIGRGTKIDNLVQVAHNVSIGPHCIIVAQVGLAGSTTIGAGSMLGGQSALVDHVSLGDRVMVGARSAVVGDIPSNSVVSGVPALPHRQHLREQAAFRRLPDMLVQFRHLREAVEKLQNPEK